MRRTELTISHNVGAAAGQDVFHAHVHVFPRYENDGLFGVYPVAPASPPREELDAMVAAIRGHLD